MIECRECICAFGGTGRPRDEKVVQVMEDVADALLLELPL